MVQERSCPSRKVLQTNYYIGLITLFIQCLCLCVGVRRRNACIQRFVPFSESNLQWLHFVCRLCRLLLCTKPNHIKTSKPSFVIRNPECFHQEIKSQSVYTEKVTWKCVACLKCKNFSKTRQIYGSRECRLHLPLVPNLFSPDGFPFHTQYLVRIIVA